MSASETETCGKRIHESNPFMLCGLPLDHEGEHMAVATGGTSIYDNVLDLAGDGCGIYITGPQVLRVSGARGSETS